MNAPASFPAPTPALVVISGGPPRAGTHASTATLDAAGQRLLKSLPTARRVLELGCGEGALAKAYKARQPDCTWLGIEADAARLAKASPHLDEALCLDLAQHSVRTLQSRFDLIVVNGLEALPRADVVLQDLAALLADGGRLVLRAENHARLSAIARLIEADTSTGVAASTQGAGMGRAHPRFQSASSIYKLLLDAGWTPALLDHEPDEPLDDRIGAAVRYMGEALGVPPGCTDRVHRMKHLVIEARRRFDALPRLPGQPGQPALFALFDVVVPTTKDQQLRVNVEQSPGLQEVQARIISYRQASSPAQALEESLPHVQSDWVLLCHQDIYFPKGFGEQLNAVLAAIPEAERASTLIGFVGMGVNRQTEQPEPAGFVIDRINCADYPASDTAVSIDELAIVVARESLHRIDPLIGWHLWATDLCLASICTHRVFPRIVKLPLFHNTQSGWQLPDAFCDSAEYLLQKHSAFPTIHTLCGVIDQGFVARFRSSKA